MKKINKYFAFLGLGIITFSSCKKQLDTVPDAIISEFLTINDVRAASRGVYDGFQSASYYQSGPASGDANGWSQLPDLMGDDFIESLESLGNWNAMSDYSFTSSTNVVSGLYTGPFEIIFRANKVLDVVKKYETGATLKEMQTIKAQMYAIRAMAHFDCMRYFAPDYGRNSTSLGIPYVNELPALPLSFKPSRKTVKENYDGIYADLDASIANFRLGGNTTGNTARIYVDSVVLYAIRARVSYYAQDWADVIRSTNLALNARPVGNMSTFIQAFATSSEAAPPTEVYWAIAKDATMTPGGATNGPSPNYRVSKSMSDTLQKLANIDGLTAYTNTNITRFNVAGQGGVMRTLSYKYNGQRTFKVFRAGEMALLRAEAKARSGDNVGGLADLNMLRTNRGAAPVMGTETGAALLNSIATLRRAELLSEGHRWFDLKRTTRAFTRTECGAMGGSKATVCNVTAAQREWAFPLPFNQLKLNENLVQNAGW